jgi:hypothetical protein
MVTRPEGTVKPEKADDFLNRSDVIGDPRCHRGRHGDESVLHPYNAPPCGDLYGMRADRAYVRQLTDDQLEDGTQRP